MSTNITVQDVVRYHIDGLSKAIHMFKLNWKRIAESKPDDSEAVKKVNRIAAEWDRRENWEIYKGYKRECSVWLTAIKIIKTHPDFTGKPIERVTMDQYNSTRCHMTPEQKAAVYHRGKKRGENIFLDRVKGRIDRIKEQLEHGAKKVTIRAALVPDPKSKAMIAGFREDVTYVPKSFEAIEKWKADRQAEYEQYLKEKADEALLPSKT